MVARLKLHSYVLIACVICFLASCSEQQDVFYATLAKAESDGAIKRGWIPAWIPSTARNLRLWYDLSTNETLLAFDYDVSRISDVCSGVDRSAVRLPRRKTRWWPDGLSRYTDTGTGVYRFYECADSIEYSDGHAEALEAYLAIDSVGHRAFYWRP